MGRRLEVSVSLGSRLALKPSWPSGGDRCPDHTPNHDAPARGEDKAKDKGYLAQFVFLQGVSDQCVLRATALFAVKSHF